MEQAIRRRLFRTGVICVAGGAVLQLIGLAGMARFIITYTGGRMETATAEQLARAAAFPHAAAVIGLGFIVFGLVLLFRSRKLHSIG